MADMPGLDEIRTRGALAEAADKFDRLARVVKDQQLSETRSGSRIALTDAYVASPDEAWAKKFMTQAIGPAMTSVDVPDMPGFVPPGRPASLSQEFVGVMAPVKVTVDPVPQKAAVAPQARETKGGAIGAQIGKPARKRSWLGRVLLGT